MSSEDIRLIKAALGVASDVELAKALGVERSTIAQWKRRGSVPGKYFGALNLDSNPSRLARYFNAIRVKLFGRPEHHYFLRAALAFLPETLAAPQGVSSAALGDLREEPVLSLMHLAQLTCMGRLGKRHPENHDDYVALVSAMMADDNGAIAAIMGDLVPQSVPQSSDQSDPPP